MTIVEGDWFMMEYRVVSHKHHKIAAEGTGRIVAFDYRSDTKATLPDVLKQAIAALETQNRSA